MSRSIWSEAPSARILPDGRRLHLQHGPIDLVVEACGLKEDVARAYERATDSFQSVLADLSGELTRLRSPEGTPPTGEIARAMCVTVAPYAPEFITPMATVAGSVADFVLAAMLENTALTKAYVNNGGDIALYLATGTFRIGVCTDPVTGKAGGIICITPDDGIGGIATSGWRGRSHSLGIADAVTVLAKTAAQADAAATMVANAVNLPDSLKITRAPASDLYPDSDLGDRLVTTDVKPLSRSEITTALNAGETVARQYQSRGILLGASIALSGENRVINHKQEQINHIREAACA